MAAALKASSEASSSPSAATSVENSMEAESKDSSSSSKLGERSAMRRMPTMVFGICMLCVIDRQTAVIVVC
jgi:hypothetical protein